MLVDRYTPEDVFARAPDRSGGADRFVLKELDRLLEDDQLCWLLGTSVQKMGRLRTSLPVVL